ncbi:c-type cytochrome [Burkholderia ambifaria]|uniref:c-type cytochrome n=1 Tax=Burkholderia ambifaria TaxID=152480 RepID=UPI0015917054|nr:cytochrome c [Burkholderia ambifaria]
MINIGIRRIGAIWLLPVLAGSVISIVASHYLPISAADQAERQAQIIPAVRFKAISVDLPPSVLPFPPGVGAELAIKHCQMCHAPATVLEQPPLTQREWEKVIQKMRVHFGAPIPESDIRELAHYFSVINGRPDDAGPSVVDDQAS